MTEKILGRCRCINKPTGRFTKGEIYLYEKFLAYVRLSSSVDGVFISNIFAHGFDSYFIDLSEERDDKLNNILK